MEAVFGKHFYVVTMAMSSEIEQQFKNSDICTHSAWNSFLKVR